MFISNWYSKVLDIAIRRNCKKAAILLFTVTCGLNLLSCESVDTTDTSETTETSEELLKDDLNLNGVPDRHIDKLSMMIAYPGESIPENNDIRSSLADRTGVDLEEKWLPNEMTSTDYVQSIIESGEYPDLIDGGDGMKLLYEEGVLFPWDEYIEKYSNIRELYSEEEWDSYRQDDGHIYWANVFGPSYGESKETSHHDYAFWIQARVLEWDNYPEIRTLDEYFDLLERYYEANPMMPDGSVIIPYTVLCDDWRYYCIESAPLYLAGYPNLGSVIVNEDDPTSPYVIDYNTTATTEAYYRKLNAEYLAGIIDPEFATQTYEEYIAKLQTGCVLGMSDQFWDFSYATSASFAENGLTELGCDYVPLGLTLEEGQSNKYHIYDYYPVSNYSGVAVTTSCKNPDIAFKFINDLLDQESHDLRFWGIEGEDYLVDDKGYFYRTEEMRENWEDPEYQRTHCCQYSFLPQWLGTSRDEMNAMQPQYQPSEFYATVSEPVANCFKAYGAGGYADMLNSDRDYRQPDWAPLYETSSSMSDADLVWNDMSACKHEWIPRLVVSTDFDATWESYLTAYEACNPQVAMDDLQNMIDRRMERLQ